MISDLKNTRTIISPGNLCQARQRELRPAGCGKTNKHKINHREMKSAGSKKRNS